MGILTKNANVKLLYKTTRDYLIASVSILIFTGVALFVTLRNEVGDEMDEQLELQADELFAIARSGELINSPFAKIEKVDSNSPIGKVFGDSMIFDRVQQVEEEYYFLRETQNIEGQRYQALVMTSHIGWDRYYLTISYIFILVALLLTGSGVAINYLSNKKIWAPFFDNLKNVREFSVSSPTELKLKESSIAEFKELNLTLKALTDKSRREYLSLREFTENASHEIQTPLSIIRSKLDRMSQMDISEELAEYIVQAKSGVDRLSKMNKSLLLLAKLDNAVFKDNQPIELNVLLNSLIRNMEDLFSTRQIKLQENTENTTISADPYLAETLLTNLLSNALRYTPVSGLVDITLANRLLSISNTGEKQEFPEELIFERFTKSQSNINSTGLGLAIAKEICKMNNWDISYRFKDGLHRFEVQF